MRQGTIAGIVAGLTSVLEDIAAADALDVEIVGWRGQQAFVPPSAWLNLSPATTTHGRGGKVDDSLPFELWLTRPPAAAQSDELQALAELADLAVPIIDDACKPSTALARFGVEWVRRNGFEPTTADQADGEGARLAVPALRIPIVARWSGTYC